MKVTFDENLKSHIEENPSQYKYLYMALRNIENFMDTYKSSTNVNVQSNNSSLLLNLRIKGYVSPFELEDIMRQINSISCGVPFTVNDRLPDRNL